MAFVVGSGVFVLIQGNTGYAVGHNGCCVPIQGNLKPLLAPITGAAVNSGLKGVGVKLLIPFVIIPYGQYLIVIIQSVYKGINHTLHHLL